MLMELAGRGLVEFEKPGSVYLWSITEDGIKLLTMVEEEIKEESKTFVNNDVIEVRDKDGRVTGAINAKFFRDGGRDKERDVRREEGGVRGVGGEDDSVVEAYKWLKEHGWTLVTDIIGWFGEGVMGVLKKKDLVVFNTIDGVEYVNAK